MSAPTRPIPNPQVRAFNLAMCERLGLDAAEVVDDFRADWVVSGDDEFARVSVSFTTYVPAAELIAMFNNAGAAPGSDANRVIGTATSDIPAGARVAIGAHQFTAGEDLEVADLLVVDEDTGKLRKARP